VRENRKKINLIKNTHILLLKVNDTESAKGGGMEKVSVFECAGYKEFLRKWLESQPRGAKVNVARAARCQSAYFSRVLNGTADLNLEQGQGAAEALGLSDQETHYFLLSIQHDRAGNGKLRTYFSKQLEDVKRERLNLKERFKVKMTLSHEDQATYYSSWIYCAAHVLLSVPQYQTKETLSAKLGLTPSRTNEILEFLCGTGLAKFEKNRYQIGTTRIHVGKDSPLLSKHHMNWRVQAMRSLDREGVSHFSDDLHYSAIVSLSQSDSERLKDHLVRAIEYFNATVKDSNEEKVQCFTLDFFDL